MPETRACGFGKVLLWILCLCFVAVTLVQVFFFVEYRATGSSSDQVEFTIEEGQDWDSVLAELKDEGLIRSVTAGKILVKLDSNAKIYAGVYDLNKGMNTQDILDYLSNPDNQVLQAIEFTITPGTWAKDVAAQLELYFPFTAEEILAKWNDLDYIRELSETYTWLNPASLESDDLKVRLEGYLYPDTYYLDQDMDIDGITRMFLDNFNAMVEANQADIDASDLSLEEILTLASIVQFEAGDDEDMPMIASVFDNRLAQGINLESSVTVCYALYEEFSDATACESSFDIDSPYNTYLNEGLPIGPIDNPGLAAIQAVLHPAESDYLFFAADIHHVKDGGIYYSATWDEHYAICEELGLIY